MEQKQTGTLKLLGFLEKINQLEVCFDTRISAERAAEYHKKLEEWGVTDEEMKTITDQILKNYYKFPALAAFRKEYDALWS